jgi:hypothetical protein
VDPAQPGRGLDDRLGRTEAEVDLGVAHGVDRLRAGGQHAVAAAGGARADAHDLPAERERSAQLLLEAFGQPHDRPLVVHVEHQPTRTEHA